MAFQQMTTPGIAIRLAQNNMGVQTGPAFLILDEIAYQGDHLDLLIEGIGMYFFLCQSK